MKISKVWFDDEYIYVENTDDVSDGYEKLCKLIEFAERYKKNNRSGRRN